MHTFPPLNQFQTLIDLARAEDMGSASDDCTSRLSIAEDVVGVGKFVLKQQGVVCGLPIVQHVCDAYDIRLKVEGDIASVEGQFFDRVTQLINVRGPLRALLAAERVMLNFVQRMSGVATLSREFVNRIEGTSAKIIDTRKTLPGFRALDKYAAGVGGAVNHRIGLYDMLLVKDNHLAAHIGDGLQQAVTEMVRRSRAEAPHRLIEIEVDTLDQLREVLRVDGVDMILLDNMDCDTLRAAVQLRQQADRRDVIYEASGGVNLNTVRAIAETGVERISVGAITHSAVALDIGLDVTMINK